MERELKKKGRKKHGKKETHLAVVKYRLVVVTRVAWVAHFELEDSLHEQQE